MQGLLGIARAIDAVTEWNGKSVGWLILVAILLSAGNAIVRKTLNVSSNGALLHNSVCLGFTS